MTPDDMSKDNKAVNLVYKDYANIFWVNYYTYTYKDYI